MLDQYVSLNPDFKSRQEYYGRRGLTRQRYRESMGGEGTTFAGLTMGLAAGGYFYNRAKRSGFTVLPF